MRRMRMETAVWMLLCLGALAANTWAVPDDLYHMPARTKRQASGVEGKTLAVVSILHDPYLMKEGNNFVGYIPDLLEEIKGRTGISYTLSQVADGRWGAYNEATKTWNGMIGQLVKKDNGETGADMVAAALTMTSQRKTAVNFIVPFQSTGLTALVKKPHMEPTPNTLEHIYFTVLEPLAPEVWTMVSACIVIVGVCMWVINKFNPYEWSGRWSIGRASEHQAETFNLSGSLWFAFTTLQWQGFERAPRSTSARVLSIFWFVFVTLTLVTYTGSVVNILFWASTVHGKDLVRSPISSLEDLIMHPKYSGYGVLRNSSSYKYLMQAKGPEYDVIRHYFKDPKNDENLVSSMEEGVKKVREGNFGFVCELHLAQHYANQWPCDIMVSDKVFGKRSYGFAVRKNLEDGIENALHVAILQMHEVGILEALEQKWFKENGQCWNVTMLEKTVSRVSALYLNKPKAVALENFWGPLTVLAVGIILSFVVAAFEIIYYKYRGRYDPKNRPGHHQLHADNVEDTA